MRTTLAVGAVSLSLVAAATAQMAPKPAHVIVAAAELKWGPRPSRLREGSADGGRLGNPSKAGPFVVRLKAPAGFKVMPHFHPTDENITVISGTFALGMGEKFDAAALKELGPGGYGLMPAEMRHFAMAKTAVVVQVHGTGPFALTYVNPADDPSKRVAPVPAK